MAELGVAWLSNYAVHSTLLIGAAWVISTTIRLQPATRDLVWKLALLGGLATPTGAVSGQLLVGESERNEQRIVRDVREARGPLMPSSRTGAGVRTVRFESRVVDPSPGCMRAIRASTAVTLDWLSGVQEACGAHRTPWARLAVILWLLGASFGAVLELRGRRSLRGVFESLADPCPRVQKTLAALSTRTGVRVRRAGVSPLVESPSVLAGEVMAIPIRCAEELSPEELKAAIAHELAHIQRRDLAWLSVFRWVAVLCWLQPLNWLAIRRIQEAAERVCDDWAIACTGEPLALASAISTVVQWSHGPARATVAVAMTGVSGAGLTERVGRILQNRGRDTDPLWLRFALLLALGSPMLVLPTLPVPLRPSPGFSVEVSDDLLHAGEVDPWSGLMERRVVIARLRTD